MSSPLQIKDGLIMKINKIILFLKMRRNPTVLNHVPIQNNTWHSLVLKFTISRMTKQAPSLLYVVRAMQESWGRNSALQRSDTMYWKHSYLLPATARIKLRALESLTRYDLHYFSPPITRPPFPPPFFLVVACYWVICHFGVTSSPTQSRQVPHYILPYLPFTYHTFRCGFVMLCSSCL